ncbi:MAG: hypothetical protein PF692_05115 [Kiritimatiellae bacterium]|jgi:virulence-associated protein VapD|nr:hypothetical protein [Kiritimatiellia bacterium]
MQIVDQSFLAGTVNKEALSVVPWVSPGCQSYRSLGKLCNVDVIMSVEFLNNQKSETTNAYAAIRFQLIDCRYGFKVVDRVFYSPLNQSELKKTAKDLAIIYSSKISKLNKFSESTKLIKFKKVITDEKTKNKRWAGWAAASYLDTLYLEDVDCLVLERDRMAGYETDSLAKDKFSGAPFGSIITVGISMSYRKAGHGEYDDTLVVGISKSGSGRSLGLGLGKDVNFFSKSSSLAGLARLKADITEAGQSKMRLMSTQATYFEQAKEYDKALSLIETLVALDPKNSIYKERRDKIYKDFSSKNEE